MRFWIRILVNNNRNIAKAICTTMLGNFPQHFGRHVFVRQLLEDLLATLADITAAGENEGQWAN